MATENVEILQVNTAPSVKSVADLKREIKELKGQLLGLEQGTAEYNKVLTEVANKTHDLKEVQEQVARSSNDFGDQLRNVRGTVAGLSGAFQTVLGSLSLMGVEMGDDVKMLKMLQSAMAITQGVAAIDSGVKAFKALTISIKASVMAMNGLKKALITSGIGAAAIAVGVLVSKLSDWKAKEEEVAEAEEKTNAELRERYALTNRLLRVESKYYNDMYQTLPWIVEMHRQIDAAEKEAVNGMEEGSSVMESTSKAVAARYQKTQELIESAAKRTEDLWAQILKHNTDSNWKATAEGQRVWGEYYKARMQAAYNDANEQKLILQEWEEFAKKKAANVKDAAKEASATVVQNDTGAFTPTATQDTGAEAAQQADELQALTDYYVRRAEIMISGETDAQDQLLQLDMDYRDKREELLRQRLDDNLITQQDFDNQLAQLEVEAVELQMEQEERLTEKKKEETEKRKAIEKSYVQSLKSVAGSISSILGTIGDNMKEGTQEWKNVKIAQATIDTIAGGITAFMTTMEQIGGIPGIIAGAAAAATVVATGIAEIAKIRNTKVSKSSSGGGSVSTPSASAVSVNATQVTPTRQVQTDEDIANLPDTKVYVLEEDITNAQKKVQVTTENATY